MSTIEYEKCFPDDENVKHYTTLIKTQGVEVCRKAIDKEWINDSLAKYSFGIAKISKRAQIGQASSKKYTHLLKGFVLCRVDIAQPNILWIDLICSKEQSKLGSELLQQVEEYAKTEKEIKVMMLYSLHEEKLKNWYIKQGYSSSSVQIWDGKPKAYLMSKFLV